MRKLVDHRRDFGPKAPITEALVDIRTKTPDDLELDELRGFVTPLSQRYTTSKLQTHFESHIRVEGGQPTPTVVARHAARGFSFFTANQDRVVQARRDGYTFSKLPPYESWAELKNEATELWVRYKEVARPETVDRVAVRYINRIPLPKEGIKVEEWFDLHPNAPETLGPMREFLVRIAVTHPDNPQYRAVVTQATQPRAEDGALAMILDIDVFTIVDLNPESEEIWQTLDELRVFKNDVFFGTITKKTEESLL